MLILVVSFDTKIQPKSCKLEIIQIGLFVAFGIFHTILYIVYYYIVIHI